MDSKNKEFYLKYADFIWFAIDSNDFLSFQKKCQDLKKAYEHELEVEANLKNQGGDK